MTAWMLYCVVVGALVAVAAHAAERVARAFRLPTRWSWIAALIVSFALCALAPYRRASHPVEVASSGAAASASDVLRFMSTIDNVTQKMPSSIAPLAIGAWVAATAILGVLILLVYGRLSRARRKWPITELHGNRVRVSPSVGPVVLGLAKPEIVVPRWLLVRPSEEQRLVVAHESEHLATHDALTLAVGTVACALMPWNPAVWFMFSRLRLAVELDCDARVLRRHGVEIQSYGTLLIDVAAHAPPLRFGVAALANSPSHLHQRIIAMQPRLPKFARVRASVAGLFAAGALLAACKAELPTAAEIDQMDVASAEVRARASGSIARADSVIYLVEGQRVSKDDAYKLRASDIASLDVRGANASGGAFIEVHRVDGVRRKMAPGGELPIVLKGKLTAATAPLLLIDGKRSTQADLNLIKREDIETVEVLKGASALAQYGEEAAKGVITVRTKQGSK